MSLTGYDAHGNFLPQQQLIDDYETEIERLRAVLEEIANAGAVTRQWLQRIAIRALKEKP